jgi:hypothetical protein
MTNKEAKKTAKKAAKQHLLSGKTKQETFDSLKGISNLPVVDVAKIVQSIPTLKDRQKYKIFNNILIVLLSITAFSKTITGLTFVLESGIIWFPVLFIFLLINILLLCGVVTYSAGCHKFVAFFSMLGVINSIEKMISDSFVSPLILIDLTIAVCLAGLGLYLNYVLYPEYEISKIEYRNSEGEVKFKRRILFKD